jgi:hypothetical protein
MLTTPALGPRQVETGVGDEDADVTELLGQGYGCPVWLAESATSHSIATPRPPLATISSTTREAATLSMSDTPTIQPSSASARA